MNWVFLVQQKKASIGIFVFIFSFEGARFEECSLVKSGYIVELVEESYFERWQTVYSSYFLGAQAKRGASNSLILQEEGEGETEERSDD